MFDLRPDLDPLWRAASRLTPAREARAVMFMAANAGEGTSSVAASFALMSADRSERTTWLVDLDLHANPLMAAFQQGFAKGIGRPGKSYDASLDLQPFYDVIDEENGKLDQPLSRPKLLAVQQIEGTRLLVTRFMEDRLERGQTVRLVSRPEWWRKLRRSADWVVVDAPALKVSGAGLTMVPQMDGVVIVVDADKTQPEDVTSLRHQIENHGGHVLGAVMNRLRKDALLVDRMVG